MRPDLKKNYSSREVASITGLSARQLQWWDLRKLIKPSIASRRTEAGGFTERRYSPVDLFELVVTEPDGTERVEQFEDSAALNQRARELEQHWREKGWDGPFARGI